MAYQQMSKMLWNLQIEYKELVEKTEGIHGDFWGAPNLFAPLLPLGLLGLSLVSVLLLDEIRHKKTED